MIGNELNACSDLHMFTTVINHVFKLLIIFQYKKFSWACVFNLRQVQNQLNVMCDEKDNPIMSPSIKNILKIILLHLFVLFVRFVLLFVFSI
jgi:hypothetical protein